MIDQSRVADGILFATHRDRALYLGTTTANRPRWLNENPGTWRRLQNPQPDAVPVQPLVDAEIFIADRRYATAQRVASIFGISLRTLSRWGKTGAGPPKIKIGKRVLFDVVTISKWLASRET
jgi:predicted DNA-binding transcriptional regulator AlpA